MYLYIRNHLFALERTSEYIARIVHLFSVGSGIAFKAALSAIIIYNHEWKMMSIKLDS
jgi:hypothetical protein